MSVKSEEMKGLSWGRCRPAGAAAAVQLSSQVEGIASWEYSVPYQGSVDVVWPCKNIERCSLLFRWMQPLPQHRMLSLTLLGSLPLAIHSSRSLSMRQRPFDVIRASSQSSRHVSLRPRSCLLCSGYPCSTMSPCLQLIIYGCKHSVQDLESAAATVTHNT